MMKCILYVDICRQSCDGLLTGDLDPTVFVILDDQKVYRALTLPGVPVGPHATDTHHSSMAFTFRFL
jgi:hypothetical protein